MLNKNPNTMKKLLTLIFVISVITGVSQETISFTNSEATWNVVRTFTNGNPEDPSFIETNTNIYGYYGDSLIGNDLWLKMYTTQDSNFISDLILAGLLKQESGLVIFKDTTNSIDTIYNFNLQTGDSVLYDFGFGIEYLKINTIDSIEINETFYKRFYFDQSQYFPPLELEEMWIEEIGSIHGPLFPKYPKLFSTEALADSLFVSCYKVGNTLVWNNPNYDSCYINIVMSRNEIYDKRIKTFPNPVKDELRIEIPENKDQNVRILIYDLLGNLIINRTYDQAVEISINTTSLENSFYILKIETGNKKYIQKFIKQ